MASRGIGKGLSALLTESPNGVDELRSIPVDLIQPNPQQPRSNFDGQQIEQLAESISAKGVLQPILVSALADGKYQLIAGERRWRASIKAGLKEIPAVIKEGQLAAPAQTVESLEAALVENMAREDLNSIEEARACAELVDRGATFEQVGRLVGRSRSAVSNLVRLLDLPEDVQGMILDGKISEGHGRAILQVKDQKQRRELAKRVAARGLSVREAEGLARSIDSSAKSDPKKSGAVVSLHPDLEQARTDAEEALAALLGTNVKVTVKGKGAKAEVHFDQVSDIFRLVESFPTRKAA